MGSRRSFALWIAALTLGGWSGCGGTSGTGATTPGSDSSTATVASAAATAEPAASPPSSAPPTEEPSREAVPVKGSEYTRGRSTVLVNAPIAKVRKTVTDYEKYPEFLPEHSNTKVLGRIPGGGQQIYMELKIMSGTVRMWARLDIPKPQVADGEEIWDSFYKEGNVEEWKTMWRMRALDENRTQLSFEIRIIPKVFVPVSMMNDLQQKAAYETVLHMKKRIEETP